MIRLLAPQRRTQLALLLAIALAQLGAGVAVASGLHRLAEPGMLAPLAALALAAFALEVVQRRIAEAIGLGFAAEIRESLFRRLLAADPQMIRARRHGAMLQSFVGDLTALRQWVSDGVVRALLAVVSLTGLLGWLALQDPRLALALALVCALAIGLGGLLVAPLNDAVVAVRRARGQVSALVSDRLAASATVLACGRGESEAKRLMRRVAALNVAALRRAWFSGTLRALPHLAMTAMLIAMVLGAAPGTAARLPGQLLVAGLIGHALRDLARAAELAVPGRISHTRLARLFAIAPLAPEKPGRRRKGEAGVLVIDRLRLAPGSAPLSLRLASGMRVLVEGDPHLRQALFAALGGIAGPYGGKLRWNGESLGAASPQRRRKLVGWASPALPPVSGSMRLNLRYRAPSASAEALAALEAAWAVDPAEDLSPPRLALLRAMLGKPPVLVLEPEDLALDGADHARLARAVAGWSGVVLFASSSAKLRAAATHCLRIDAAVATLCKADDIGGLSLVAEAGRWA